MLGRRGVGIDNAHSRARLERGNEIVEQAIGLSDLVIHVHQDGSVERISRQPRIVWLTEADHYVLQSEIALDCANSANIQVRHLLR